MKVLIINDDGVHAPGLIELAKRVQQQSEVFVVAPSVEQSGVSQAITFLSPLFPVPITGEEYVGYSVNGTPVDCLKLAVSELCPWKPDLVLSGINGGLNAGINVGHSGTVGGALAAATFDIPAISISLEYTTKRIDFAKASDIAWPLIEKLRAIEIPSKSVININIPTIALAGGAEVVYVPIETNPMAYDFDRGNDPKGRPYFWSTNRPIPEPSSFPTDTQELARGKITVSVLSYDLNAPAALDALKESAKGGEL